MGLLKTFGMGRIIYHFSIKIITFAFLNFEKPEDAKNSIDALHEKDFRTEEQKTEQASDLKDGTFECLCQST